MATYYAKVAVFVPGWTNTTNASSAASALKINVTYRKNVGGTLTTGATLTYAGVGGSVGNYYLIYTGSTALSSPSNPNITNNGMTITGTNNYFTSISAKSSIATIAQSSGSSTWFSATTVPKFTYRIYPALYRNNTLISGTTNKAFTLLSTIGFGSNNTPSSLQTTARNTGTKYIDCTLGSGYTYAWAVDNTLSAYSTYSVLSNSTIIGGGYFGGQYMKGTLGGTVEYNVSAITMYKYDVQCIAFSGNTTKNISVYLSGKSYDPVVKTTTATFTLTGTDEYFTSNTKNIWYSANSSYLCSGKEINFTLGSNTGTISVAGYSGGTTASNYLYFWYPFWYNFHFMTNGSDRGTDSNNLISIVLLNASYGKRAYLTMSGDTSVRSGWWQPKFSAYTSCSEIATGTALPSITKKS